MWHALAGASAGLLVLSWLTTEHFLPWVSWHSEATAFGAVLLVCWAVLGHRRQARPPSPVQVPWAVVPFAAFAGIAVVQGLTGIMTFRGDVLVVVFYVALCLACLTLGFNSTAASAPAGHSFPFGRVRPVDALAIAFVAGGVASTVVVFAQVFDVLDSGWIVRMPDLRRPGGNLGQPNQMATLAVMAVASVAYLHVSARLGAWVSGFLVFVLCAGLAATESRAGAVGLLALLLWWQLKRRTFAGQVSAWAAPVVGLGFGALLLLWPHFLNATHLLTSQVENRFAVGSVRTSLWAQLLEAAWQRPWWGWGILEVVEAHNAVAHAYPLNNPFSYSHNLVLDWVVWMGFPIAAVALAVTSRWLWLRCRDTRQLLPWYALAVMAPLATHSMLEFPYAYAYFLAPVLYLVGALERHRGAAPVLRVGGKTAAAGVLLASAVLAWSAVEYVAIEEDFRIVRFEQLRIGKTPENQPKPQVILLTQLGALLDGSRVEIEPRMSPQHLDQLRELALRYPWVATQYRYALALALNGHPQEAMRQFQVIRWQRDEKLYRKIQGEVERLAASQYPQLNALKFP